MTLLRELKFILVPLVVLKLLFYLSRFYSLVFHKNLWTQPWVVSHPVPFPEYAEGTTTHSYCKKGSCALCAAQKASAPQKTRDETKDAIYNPIWEKFAAQEIGDQR